MRPTRTQPKRLNHEPKAVTYAREKSGLSMTEVAEQCGVSLSLISEFEKGTRSATPAMIIKLAAVFNCPVVVLERKREPEATPQAAGQMRGLRTDERADTDDVPELRSSALTDGA